jgi:hypothetical protein
MDSAVSKDTSDVTLATSLADVSSSPPRAVLPAPVCASFLSLLALPTLLQRPRLRLCCASGRSPPASEDEDSAEGTTPNKATALPSPSPLLSSTHGDAELSGAYCEAVPGLRIVFEVISASEAVRIIASLAAETERVPANNIHRADQWGWRFHCCGQTLETADKLRAVVRPVTHFPAPGRSALECCITVASYALTSPRGATSWSRVSSPATLAGGSCRPTPSGAAA